MFDLMGGYSIASQPDLRLGVGRMAVFRLAVLADVLLVFALVLLYEGVRPRMPAATLTRSAAFGSNPMAWA